MGTKSPKSNERREKEETSRVLACCTLILNMQRGPRESIESFLALEGKKRRELWQCLFLIRRDHGEKLGNCFRIGNFVLLVSSNSFIYLFALFPFLRGATKT